MKKNVLFIYRGQVLLEEFLPEYEKHIGNNCVLLVEKGIPFNLVDMTIKRLKLSVELKTIDDLLENNINMKFNSIVMNPPYKGGLHIDMFNKAFDLLIDGGIITCIHPSTPFINRKPTKTSGKTKKIKEIVSKYRTRLTLIDGNKIFDAGFFTPLSITQVKKVLDNKIEIVYSHIDSTNKEVKVYNKLDDIFIHGNDLVIGIYNKILSRMNQSVESKLYRNGGRGNLYLDIIRTCGHPPKNGETRVNPDFYCLIYKKNENNFNDLIIQTPNEKSEQKGGTGFNQISINSIEEGEYLFKYLLTKFSRFCVSLYKMNIQLTSKELDILPYMNFSEEWTDEKLFEYFELTQEEINFIEEYIPNWYERDFN
jgi:hypothetical protein